MIVLVFPTVPCATVRHGTKALERERHRNTTACLQIRTTQEACVLQVVFIPALSTMATRDLTRNFKERRATALRKRASASNGNDYGKTASLRVFFY